jgi:hypothetical protein
MGVAALQGWPPGHALFCWALLGYSLARDVSPLLTHVYSCRSWTWRCTARCRARSAGCEGERKPPHAPA